MPLIAYKTILTKFKQKKLNIFIIIYLNNIFIYTKNFIKYYIKIIL